LIGLAVEYMGRFAAPHGEFIGCGFYGVREIALGDIADTKFRAPAAILDPVNHADRLLRATENAKWAVAGYPEGE
jgi:hypothetical protein